MANIPDFQRLAFDIASRCCESVDLLRDELSRDPDALKDIVDQLKQIWNARGAADIAAVDQIAHTNYEAIAHAIRDLDRP